MADKVAIVMNGSYSISKFGLEAFSDPLRQEPQPQQRKCSIWISSPRLA
jgi:hypothetical protein